MLIFSQMSRVLDILEDYCQFRGHRKSLQCLLVRFWRLAYRQSTAESTETRHMRIESTRLITTMRQEAKNSCSCLRLEPEDWVSTWSPRILSSSSTPIGERCKPRASAATDDTGILRRICKRWIGHIGSDRPSRSTFSDSLHRSVASLTVTSFS